MLRLNNLISNLFWIGVNIVSFSLWSKFLKFGPAGTYFCLELSSKYFTSLSLGITYELFGDGLLTSPFSGSFRYLICNC